VGKRRCCGGLGGYWGRGPDAGELPPLLGGGGVPEADGAVAAAGREELAVGAEGDGGDGRLATVVADRFSGGDVVHHDDVGGAQGDALAVRGEGGAGGVAGPGGWRGDGPRCPWPRPTTPRAGTRPGSRLAI